MTLVPYDGKYVAELERRQRFGVGDRAIFGTAGILEQRVLRPDARVVEPGGDGVCLDDLAVLILQDVTPRPVEDAFLALYERCGVLGPVQAVASRFNADDLDTFVRDELVEVLAGMAIQHLGQVVLAQARTSVLITARGSCARTPMNNQDAPRYADEQPTERLSR